MTAAGVTGPCDSGERIVTGDLNGLWVAFIGLWSGWLSIGASGLVVFGWNPVLSGISKTSRYVRSLLPALNMSLNRRLAGIVLT